MNLDSFIAGLPDLSGGVDPELQQALSVAQNSPAMQVPIRPTKWNNRETRTPLQVLQDEQANQAQANQPPKSNALDAVVSAMPPLQPPKAADVDMGTGAGYAGAYAPLQAGMIGVGRSIDRLAGGARQAVQSIPGVGPYIAGGLDKIDALTGATPPSTDPAVQKANTAAYAPLAAQYPAATTVGETLPYLAAGSPLAMAGMGALDYGTPTERAINAGSAYAGGKVGQLVGRAFGPKSMAAAIPEAESAASSATNKWGIPTTVGQQPGASNTAQLAESVLSNIPFGGAVNKARTASYQGFNRAVGDTIGVDTTKLTPEVLGAAKSAAGGTIGDISGRTTLAVDPQFATDFSTLSNRAQQTLVGENLDLANKWIANVHNAINPETGTIPGTIYKTLRSDIAAAMPPSGTVRDVLGNLRGVLQQGMDRSISPADSAAWKLANSQYFNVKQVANAAKASPAGTLSPSQLLTQVNMAQPNARFGAGNDLAELAQWAKTTLPDKIPNSGTAQRLWMQKLLTGGALGGGLLGGNLTGYDVPGAAYAAPLIPLLAGRALAGKPLSDATKNLLMRGGGLLGLDLSRAQQ